LRIAFVPIAGTCGCRQLIQFVLGDVPKRRVTKIMGKARSFNNIWVETANGIDVGGLSSEESLGNAP
jgi:hypothetical protein